MSPLIGLTCGRLSTDTGSVRHYQNESYVDAVTAAGGVPILVPLVMESDLLRDLYQRLDGLLLTGGGDLYPVRYGQARHPKTANQDARRDQVELELTRWAVADGLPVLGICRGIQTLNVALGGTLIQDIPSQVDGALVHPYQTGNSRDYLAHPVTLVPDSLVARLLAAGLDGDHTLLVNSMHHQAVREPAPDCVITACAPDGVVEAIERQESGFVLGLQWHPEEMVTRYPLMRRLFQGFVEAAAAT
jgi:putative glutamine amidotransferase